MMLEYSVCRACSLPFLSVHTAGRPRVWCSPDCRRASERDRIRDRRVYYADELVRERDRRRHLARYGSPDLRGSRPCRVCGDQFATPTNHQKRCDSCRSAGFIAARSCERCGGPYKARNKRNRFCSRTCASTTGVNVPSRKGHKGRAVLFGCRQENVDRLTVFERDGWLCQLCHTPVDRSLKWPSPASASLDHVVPLSKGGDHLYVNVQLAHLRCNASKGARLNVRVGA